METNSFSMDTNSFSVDANVLCSNEIDADFGVRLSTYYLLLFLISLVGNGLVLYIICKFEKLNTVCNIFLLNLIMSDLIVTSGLPFWAIYHNMSNWVFGRVGCKIAVSVYFLGFYSSILFLTLMTFDRYLSVVYAVPSTRLRKKSFALVSSAVVWGISILACINPFLLYDQVEHFNKGFECDSVDTHFKTLKLFGQYLQLGLFFLFPLLVICYCYIRIAMTVISSRMTKKYRTVRIIFIIVLLFFACWTPYNVVLMLEGKDGVDCKKNAEFQYNLHVTLMITYMYYCINPVFYTFVGRKFQNHFRNLAGRRLPCLKNYVSTSGSHTLSDRNPEVGRNDQINVQE